MGGFPDMAGIRFLRTGKKEFLKVDEKLLAKARYYCQLMRIRTIPDSIENYPQRFSGLCKWALGECSYYEKCKPSMN